MGAIVGGFLGRAVGWYGRSDPVGFVMAVLGAIVLLIAYRLIARGPRRAWQAFVETHYVLRPLLYVLGKHPLKQWHVPGSPRLSTYNIAIRQIGGGSVRSPPGPDHGALELQDELPKQRRAWPIAPGRKRSVCPSITRLSGGIAQASIPVQVASSSASSKSATISSRLSGPPDSAGSTKA